MDLMELFFPKPKHKKKRRRHSSNLTDRQLQEVVIARDGRCMNKLCSVMHPSLAGHHIKFKSQGGSNNPEWSISLCRQCHKCADEGGVYDQGQPRLTARQWMIAVLESWKDDPCFIWGDALEYLKRKEPLSG